MESASVSPELICRLPATRNPTSARLALERIRADPVSSSWMVALAHLAIGRHALAQASMVTRSPTPNQRRSGVDPALQLAHVREVGGEAVPVLRPWTRSTTAGRRSLRAPSAPEAARAARGDRPGRREAARPASGRSPAPNAPAAGDRSEASVRADGLHAQLPRVRRGAQSSSTSSGSASSAITSCPRRARSSATRPVPAADVEHRAAAGLGQLRQSGRSAS